MEPLFRVTVNKEDNSYTLIQEGITLTEEQARQIATAYNGQNPKPRMSWRELKLIEEQNEYELVRRG